MVAEWQTIEWHSTLFWFLDSANIGDVKFEEVGEGLSFGRFIDGKADGILKLDPGSIKRTSINRRSQLVSFNSFTSFKRKTKEWNFRNSLCSKAALKWELAMKLQISNDLASWVFNLALNIQSTTSTRSSQLSSSSKDLLSLIRREPA